jgi:hypothetical protein
MKSGNLIFLEPSGPLQACNGTDLPFNTKALNKDERHVYAGLVLGYVTHVLRNGFVY